MGVICIAPDGALSGAAMEQAESPGAAVTALFHRYGELAVRRCAERTGDHALAEDAVQEGFIQVLQRLRGGDEALLSAHPARVVQRNARWAASKLMARDRSTGAKARLLDDPSLHAGTDAMERLEMRWEIEDILAQLPARQREVLNLRYVHRLPDALSAKRLGLSVRGYRCRLDRALEAARQVARARAA
jgi:RNA polymerase sigma factor (sigma-70 family)